MRPADRKTAGAGPACSQGKRAAPFATDGRGRSLPVGSRRVTSGRSALRADSSTAVKSSRRRTWEPLRFEKPQDIADPVLRHFQGEHIRRVGRLSDCLSNFSFMEEARVWSPAQFDRRGGGRPHDIAPAVPEPWRPHGVPRMEPVVTRPAGVPGFRAPVHQNGFVSPLLPPEIDRAGTAFRWR